MMSAESIRHLRKLTVLSASSVLFPSMTKMKSLRRTPRYGTMHSVSVATTARSAAQFLSTEQSCRTPSKALEQPHERLQHLDGCHRLLDLHQPDVIGQVLERVDQAEEDLLPEDAL